MNSKQDSQNSERISEEIEVNDAFSLDDFIKELEEKEKDLDISPELVIEVENSDFADGNDSDFFEPNLSVKNKLPVVPPKNNFKPTESEFSRNGSEISDLQNQLSKLQIERVEILETSRRRQFDFDNFKKRVERERGETFTKQISNLALQVLPVLDNLNRALDSNLNFNDGKSQDFQQFYDGIALVSQQLNDVLAEMGIQPIDSVGQTFDPHFHEAVATQETTEVPPNTVTAELLRGYRISERVIRPAIVKVSAAAPTNSIESQSEVE